MMKITKTDIKSICILRLSAIGDVTHVLPVIATLQDALPDVKITWIIGKLEYKLMKGLPGVDFIIYDKSQERYSIKNLIRDLGHSYFDVLLQMQYSFRANRLAWKIKAKNRIGFDKKRSREFHSYKLTHRIQAVKNQHVLDSFLEFVKPLGIYKNIIDWKIITSQSDHEFAKSLIKNNKFNVVISPCSSASYRNWSNRKYANVVDYLVEKYNAHVILCGGPSELEINTSNEIAQLTKYPLTNITGKDTLKQLFALMKLVDLVISPDSGPMHIANAAKTQVIGLHAATTAKRSGAYLCLDLAIDCFEQAADIFLKKPAHKIRWGGQIKHKNTMDLIEVSQVTEKIDKVLSVKKL